MTNEEKTLTERDRDKIVEYLRSRSQEKIDLSWGNLERMHLSCADLTNATLQGTILTYAQLNDYNH